MGSGGAPSPSGAVARVPPRQFMVRAVAVVTGLTLLLVVDVHGLAFYVAWSLIVLALISEGAATLVHWQRSRHTRSA